MSSNGGALGIASSASEVDQSTIDEIYKDKKSISNDPSIEAEKGEVIETENDDSGHLLLSHDEQFPEDPNGEIETQQVDLLFDLNIKMSADDFVSLLFVLFS